jgi:hypothetical protein
MYADSLLGILNSKEAAGYLRIIALLITVVVLMSSCATSTQYYENRVADDVICPLGMSAYYLPGVIPQGPRSRRDMVCMPDERMRQMATAQQTKNPESTVATQPSGEPPAGAIKADLGFPTPGTRWRASFINAQGVTNTTLYTVLDDGMHAGKLVYRRRGGRSTTVFDKGTANQVATLRDGKESESYLPHAGTLDWPLYVGKSWTSRYVYRDLVRETSIDPVQYEYRVETYEKVVVPAGTWDAFRIASKNVNGTSLSTIWYAPELKLIVKRINETTARHSSGITKTIYEIIEYPAKAETQ